MITLPAIRPDKITDVETDFGSSISASIWKKIKDNINWMEQSLPIGSILLFYGSGQKTDNSPIDAPNPNIWVPCDGSLINDSESPMNGQNTPNLFDKFLKGSDTINQTGGNSSINIQHNHGGETGETDDSADQIADSGVDFPTGAPHTHSIDNQWGTSEPIIPKYFTLQPYIRIK